MIHICWANNTGIRVWWRLWESLLSQTIPGPPANIGFTFSGSIADDLKGNLPALLTKYLYYHRHHRYLEEFKQRAALCTKVWAAKGSGRWGLVIHAVSFAHRFWQKSLFQQGRICTSAGTCDLSASLLVPTRSKLGAKLINSDESIRADRRLAALPQINPWVVRGSAGRQAQSQILIGAVWAFAGVEVRKRTDRQTCLLQTANLS